MARVILGPLVEDVRGRLGGVIFSKSLDINYAKRYAVPRYRRTLAQEARRLLFRSGIRLWGTAGNTLGWRDPWIKGAIDRDKFPRDFWMTSWLSEPDEDWVTGVWRPWWVVEPTLAIPPRVTATPGGTGAYNVRVVYSAEDPPAGFQSRIPVILLTPNINRLENSAPQPWVYRSGQNDLGGGSQDFTGTVPWEAGEVAVFARMATSDTTPGRQAYRNWPGSEVVVTSFTLT